MGKFIVFFLIICAVQSMASPANIKAPATKEPPKAAELPKEPAKDLAKEPAKDLTKEHTKDLPKEAAKEAPKEANKEHAKNDKFSAEHVVPDVISAAPEAILKVTYPSGVAATEGNELTPTQVKDKPIVEWKAEAGSFYTLCLTDPDAPSRKNPKSREFNHWLVGNIPGSAIEKGDVLSDYVGSGPPKDSGLHRYVFLLYKQPAHITFEEKHVPSTSRANRAKFSIAKFAEKYSLGKPIAGNFYQAQYDDYVPTVHKQLGA